MLEVNPTTLRFSRRAGEGVRGADYACSTEPPEHDLTRFPGRLVAALVALSLVAAFFLVQ